MQVSPSGPPCCASWLFRITGQGQRERVEVGVELLPVRCPAKNSFQRRTGMDCLADKRLDDIGELEWVRGRGGNPDTLLACRFGKPVPGFCADGRVGAPYIARPREVVAYPCPDRRVVHPFHAHGALVSAQPVEALEIARGTDIHGIGQRRDRRARPVPPGLAPFVQRLVGVLWR